MFSGQFSGGQLSVTHVGQRGDVVLSALDRTGEDLTLNLLTLGAWDEVYGKFSYAVENWLAANTFPIVRIAFGSVLLCETKTRTESYERLARLVPSVNVDADKMHDLLFRINWPRESGTRPHLLVNRTSTAVSPQLRSGLADLIIAKRSSAEVDESGVIVANAAVDDAVKVVQRRDLGGAPRVMFSEDGVLALQWQRDEYGVALIFAGDGMVSIAFRRPGQLYAENGIEVSVSEDLPPEFRDVLAKIEN